MWPAIVFAVLMAMTFVAIVGYAIQVDKKRKAKVEQAAAELGLAFATTLTGGDLVLFNKFALSHAGYSRAAESVTTADSGELRMVLFDYQYTVGSGKNKQTRSFSVVMASSPTLDMPQFTLSPENFLHRLGDFFGFTDIDFDEDQTFSDQFLLKGEKESAIREFFTAERRAALVPLGQVSIEGCGDSFLFYRSGKQRDATHLRSMLAESYSIYAKLGNNSRG